MSAIGSATLTCLWCDQVNQVLKSRLRDRPACRICGSVLVNDEVRDLDAKGFKSATFCDNLPLIVDFWSNTGANPQVMSKEFSKAAKTDVGTARFAKLNTQDHPGIAENLKIAVVPTLVLFNNGHEIARVTGNFNALEINAFTKIGLSLRER